MTLLTLRLLLGGWASKVWAFLCHRSFCQLVCMGCAVLILVQHLELAHARSEAGRWHKQFDAEHAGRKADRASYVNAQSQAAAQNKAQVSKVEQQQQKVTSDVEANYRADLARLRAEQLRPSTPASPGAPRKPGSPAPGPAPSGPSCEALPLSGPELLQAQETELQLNALIDWVLQQSAIDPNK